MKTALNNNLNDGFSMVEVILSVTFFGILFASIIFGFSTIVKLEVKTKEKIYKTFSELNETSKKYYITNEQP
jgi:hypothetical protein